MPHRRFFETQQRRAAQIASAEALVGWRDALVAELRGGGADVLGAGAGPVRCAAGSRAFDGWIVHLTKGFERMRDRGELRADAEVGRLATLVAAALRGGCLLALATRDIEDLEISLGMAIDHVLSFAPAP